MRSSDVSFRSIVPELDNVPVEKRKEIEIVEIKYPDGKVAAFPAAAVNPESGRKYSDLYARKYQAFKSGDNSERVEQLKSEIAQRQAELDGLKKAPDDKRVQENIGKAEHESFDHMTKAELADWVSKNSDEGVPSDASKDDLVKLAKKVERKQKAAA